MFGNRGTKVYARVWTQDGGEDTVPARKKGKLVITKHYGTVLTSPERTRHGKRGRYKGKPIVYVREGAGEAADTDWLAAYHGKVVVNGEGKMAPAAVNVEQVPPAIVTAGEVDEIASNQYVSDVLYGMRRTALDKMSQWILIMLVCAQLAATVYFFNEIQTSLEDLALRLGAGGGTQP